MESGERRRENKPPSKGGGRVREGKGKKGRSGRYSSYNLSHMAWLKKTPYLWIPVTARGGISIVVV